MCLIAFSRDGRVMPRDAFEYSRTENPDGIGIMSVDGVHRFIGKKAGKQAWRYLQSLGGKQHGVHFRFATHGIVSADNCHPFVASNGFALMHNGIIGATAEHATDTHSDTRLFAQWVLA